MKPCPIAAGVADSGFRFAGRTPGTATPATAAALAFIPATATWRELAAEFALTPFESGRLSPAEEVVCAHLRQGLSNREIATALGKSERTVKNQVSAILGKYDVPTRARLIALLR